MKERLITAICMLIVAVPCIFIGGPLMTLLVLFCAIVGTFEYVRAMRHEVDRLFWYLYGVLAIASVIMVFLPNAYALMLFTAVLLILYFFNIFSEEMDIEKISYLFQMFVLVSLGVKSFGLIRAISFNAVVYILILTFVNDTMAYIGGRLFGKHKLIPRISPKKTIEGSITGYVSAAAAGIVYGMLYTSFSTFTVIGSSLVIPVVSALGDLAMSSVKRHYKIKDFSRIFPGHGGVLDRIDSLLFAMLTFSVIFMGAL